MLKAPLDDCCRLCVVFPVFDNVTSGLYFFLQKTVKLNDGKEFLFQLF